MNRGALAGVRIADFSIIGAGAYIGTILSFMGAEVIKFETAVWPDALRRFPLATAQATNDLNSSPMFNDINLNKLSITLDLSQPKGVELAKRIIKLSDVVIENLRLGRMESFGLTYEAVKEIKPDIIYLSSSARGRTGPERYYIGYAPLFASFGGLAYLTGYSDDSPVELMGEIDFMSATASAFAIVAALNYRQRTGKGQFLDLSSSETIATFIGEALMDYTMNKRVQTRVGNRDEIMAPHNCYPCKGEDKWVSIAIATEEEWDCFCNAIGNPPWTQDERFADAYWRWRNQDELDKLVGEWTRNHTHYEVMDILQKVGVAAVPSFSSEELAGDPHIRERGFFTEVEHPVIGKQVVLDAPWKLSVTPARVYRAAPLLGEHNQYVFRELLGLPPEEIQTLEKEKVIY